MLSVLVFSFCMAAAVFIAASGELERAKYLHREAELKAETARNEARGKTEFLQDISHEMKKPLNVISTGIEVADMKVRTGGDVESSQRALAAAKRETLRLGRMIEGMVNMASISESAHNRKRVDFAKLIRNSADSFAISFTQQNITLKMAIAENLPDVFVEQDRLAQVMANIFANIAAYAKNSEVTLTAAVHKEYITLKLSDTGPGIEPDILPDIFKRGVSGSVGGTGYGLYICEMIIQAHGGTIKIESEPGQGTEVIFTVPVYGGQEAGHKL